jgi:hypothetical protein
MPAFTLRPNADGGTYQGWASYYYVYQSDASDATYMNTGQNGVYIASYPMADLPADAGAVSGDVIWHDRNTFTGDAPVSDWALFRYAGTDSYIGVASYGGYIAEATATYSLAPGSAAWTPTIINATEIGVYANMGINDFLYCYDLWATGTYLQAGGCLIPIYNLIGPLLGASLLWKDFLKIGSQWHQASKGTRIRWSKEELAKAWLEYKDGKRPVRYFDFGAHKWQIGMHPL